MPTKPGERILAVDDDESFLDIYKTGLQSAGYEVTTASSGAEAVALAAREDFDLVITDLSMPGEFDGQEVVRRVKAARPKTELIVLTGTPTLASAIATLKDGAYDYVFKPVVIEHLKSVVRRCLDHHRLREELSSERALRQELKIAYEELQKVEKLKEGILARLSHELKTPLFQIVLGLNVLKDAQVDLEKARRTVEIATLACSRLERTLSNLLALAEFGQAVPEVGTTAVDVEALCRGVVEGLRALWERRNLRVSVAFEPKVRAVRGTPELLSKAFEHLVHNAILFSPQGESVEIRGKMTAGFVKVAVSDKGEGIPESEFDEIFDSFYQVANYLTRKVDGLGLGLAIARRIVEAHGGSVMVASRLGQGSTFTVALPPEAAPANS
ncbi:MAG: hybrid sensor histidine kinase/response regulator [Elusimicrobia bacterium]|nr:hybrid sensor histidine kinase/response regulator [Elusimicrobiota bacterium]